MSKLKLVVYRAGRKSVRDILDLERCKFEDGLDLFYFPTEEEADKFVRPIEPGVYDVLVQKDRLVSFFFVHGIAYEIMTEDDLYRSQNEHIYAYLMHEWWAEMRKKHDCSIPVIGTWEDDDDDNFTVQEIYLVPGKDVYFKLLTDSDGGLWATVHANY